MMDDKILSCIRALADAPDEDIDHTITKRMKELDDKMTAADMKQILDDCAYSALATDFSMIVMDRVWNLLMKEEIQALGKEK